MHLVGHVEGNRRQHEVDRIVEGKARAHAGHVFVGVQDVHRTVHVRHGRRFIVIPAARGHLFDKGPFDVEALLVAGAHLVGVFEARMRNVFVAVEPVRPLFPDAVDDHGDVGGRLPGRAQGYAHRRVAGQLVQFHGGHGYVERLAGFLEDDLRDRGHLARTVEGDDLVAPAQTDLQGVDPLEKRQAKQHAQRRLELAPGARAHALLGFAFHRGHVDFRAGDDVGVGFRRRGDHAAADAEPLEHLQAEPGVQAQQRHRTVGIAEHVRRVGIGVERERFEIFAHAQGHAQAEVLGDPRIEQRGEIQVRRETEKEQIGARPFAQIVSVVRIELDVGVRVHAVVAEMEMVSVGEGVARRIVERRRIIVGQTGERVAHRLVARPDPVFFEHLVRPGPSGGWVQQQYYGASCAKQPQHPVRNHKAENIRRGR